MPLIEIQSPPIAAPFNVAAAIEQISKALSTETEIDIRHFIVTWDFVDPRHYASAGTTAAAQKADSHPVLVKVTGPDGGSDARVEIMLEAIAKQVAVSAGVGIRNVFAVYRRVSSGSVFDAGEVQTW